MAKIGVIVPVYNVELYINKCIESILNQTHKDLELILVDDGSSDNSSDICDYYASIDSRVIVIHTPNRGRSSSRNTGLEYVLKYSKCEYISFVDSDDYIKTNYLEFLLNMIEDNNCDISKVSYNIINNEGQITGCMKMKTDSFIFMNDKEKFNFINNYLISFKVFYHVWGTLFKRSLLSENIIVFADEKTVFSEDTLFSVITSLNCNSISTSEELLYFYRTSPDGIMNTTKRNEVVLINYFDSLSMEIYSYCDYSVFKENFEIIYHNLFKVILHYKVNDYINVIKECRNIKNKKRFKYYNSAYLKFHQSNTSKLTAWKNSIFDRYLATLHIVPFLFRVYLYKIVFKVYFSLRRHDGKY